MSESRAEQPAVAQPNRDRDSFVEAGRALRESIEQALELGGTQVTRNTRVLLAVIWLTASYSRISDRVYIAQLAEVAKIKGDVGERHTRRALKFWHDLGVIWWEPAETRKGRGNGRASLLSLTPPARRPLLAVVQTRPDLTEKPGHICARHPATSGPPTEEALREGNRGEQTSPLQDFDLKEWGAQLAARLERSAAPVGTIERLVEICPDADPDTPGVLKSFYDRLPTDFIEHARERILREEPREPARYAVGIARKELRKRRLA